jgi:hypothetical protein
VSSLVTAAKYKQYLGPGVSAVLYLLQDSAKWRNSRASRYHYYWNRVFGDAKYGLLEEAAKRRIAAILHLE